MVTVIDYLLGRIQAKNDYLLYERKTLDQKAQWVLGLETSLAELKEQAQSIRLTLGIFSGAADQFIFNGMTAHLDELQVYISKSEESIKTAKKELAESQLSVDDLTKQVDLYKAALDRVKAANGV